MDSVTIEFMRCWQDHTWDSHFVRYDNIDMDMPVELILADYMKRNELDFANEIVHVQILSIIHNDDLIKALDN